jgi:hypothetical protein
MIVEVASCKRATSTQARRKSPREGMLEIKIQLTIENLKDNCWKKIERLRIEDPQYAPCTEIMITTLRYILLSLQCRYYFP